MHNMPPIYLIQRAVDQPAVPADPLGGCGKGVYIPPAVGFDFMEIIA